MHWPQIGGVAIMWREEGVRGNPEKAEVEMEGRLVRLVLTLRCPGAAGAT